MEQFINLIWQVSHCCSFIMLKERCSASMELAKGASTRACPTWHRNLNHKGSHSVGSLLIASEIKKQVGSGSRVGVSPPSRSARDSCPRWSAGWRRWTDTAVWGRRRRWRAPCRFPAGISAPPTPSAPPGPIQHMSGVNTLVNYSNEAFKRCGRTFS